MTATVQEPSRTTRAPSRSALGMLVLAGLVAFALYRPDRALPFHHLDFSEFLPILQSSASFGERFWKLVEFYAQFGRVNVVPYALLSAKWELFGWWSPGWQWSRFLVMIGIVALTFRLLRQLGASRGGAAAGASVFLIAPSATLGWVQLTMGEPLGTLLLLALCLTIFPAQRLRTERWRWVVGALLTTGILLTKEMLAPTLLLPLGLAIVTDDEGRVARPAIRRQAVQFLVMFVVVGLLCLGPVLALMLAARGKGYYFGYGETVWPARQIAGTWLSTFVPLDVAYGLPRRALQAVSLMLAVLVASGWWLYLRSGTGARHHAWLLAVALLFPLVGALVYAPWPAYLPFYAIPYLIGTSLLVAFALTGFERASTRLVTAGAYGWWGALLLVGSINAHRQAQQTAAYQLMTHRLVTRIASLQGIDSVLVATPRVAEREWEGAASTLRRYAGAVNADWPPARDAGCSKARVSPRSVVIYGEGACPRPAVAEPIVERYRRFSLRRRGFVAESVRVDIEHARPVR